MQCDGAFKGCLTTNDAMDISPAIIIITNYLPRLTISVPVTTHMYVDGKTMYTL